MNTASGWSPPSSLDFSPSGPLKLAGVTPMYGVDGKELPYTVDERGQRWYMLALSDPQPLTGYPLQLYPSAPGLIGCTRCGWAHAPGACPEIVTINVRPTI